jgi:uncharacterized membrane protein YidH (DUF202 family)
MFTNRRPRTIDLGFIIASVTFIFVFSCVDVPVKDSTLIPSAIEGITTVTGLIFAVDGLLITRYYSDSTNPIQRIRCSCYVLVLAIGSALIGVAYLAFLSGVTMLAIKIALTVFNISYAVAVALVFHFIYFLDLPALLSIRKSKSQ